ncbi:MAG: hypothetical protein JST59_29505 [Actinobacteria bacterium]|nr:hypothetical protein [Actinomycetota bacterium]
MSAELLVSVLVIDETQTPDFAAAHRAVEAIEPADVLEPEYFDDWDPGESAGLRRVRHRLHLDLHELQTSLTSWREVAEFIVRGALVYVSGGLSHGDSPTETCSLIWRLRAVAGVLAAAGFEEAGPS